MNKCLFCDNTATIHLTSIFNTTKREVHLCENCARKHHLNSDAQQEINIQALLQFLTGQATAAAAESNQNSLTCPHCGMKYAQFRAQGRLGCPQDYDVFREALEPLLERIHRHTRHPGKIPGCHRSRRQDAAKQLLIEELRGAVLEERYEEAARLRDQIRSMGIADES
jgi:protein arginine kinase activator